MNREKFAGDMSSFVPLSNEGLEGMETELRRLLRQIEEEYNAAKSGMNGLASGTARHAFINARMENIDRCRVELTKLVGEGEALKLIVQQNDGENSEG